MGDDGGEEQDRVPVEVSANVPTPEAEASATIKYGLERLQEEIGRADRDLSASVDAFLIGGCAMAYADLKAATKDIDVVVEARTGFDLLRRSLLNAGYERIDPEGPYEQLDAAGYFDKDDAPPAGTSTFGPSAMRCSSPPA